MSRVYKSKKNQKFTTIFNSVLQKDSLSWSAKGLYCYLNSLPDDWVMYKTEIMKHSSTGRTAFRTAWDELESLGYIIGADMIRGEGKFAGREYIFYDLSEDDRNALTVGQNDTRPLHKTSHGEIESEMQKKTDNPAIQDDLPLSETSHGTVSQNVPLQKTYNTTKDLLQISADAQIDTGKSDLQLRKENFRKEITSVGGLIYTKQMLDEFFRSWSEANRAKKPKMKFEKEGSWELDLRLANWARRNLSKIRVYLTDEEKSIRTKQLEFRNSLIPFFAQYPEHMITAFYKHWIQPENKPVPQIIRWEAEEFWDLPQRLSQWSSRNSQGIPQRHETAAR